MRNLFLKIDNNFCLYFSNFKGKNGIEFALLAYTNTQPFGS